MSDVTTVSSSANRPDRFAVSMSRRRRKNVRFHLYGLLAIAIAFALLIVLVSSIVLEARSAVTRHEVQFQIAPSEASTRAVYTNIRSALFDQFDVPDDRISRLQIGQLVSPLAAHPIALQFQQNELDRRVPQTVNVPVSDDADLYLKGKASLIKRYYIELQSVENGYLTGDFADILASLRRWRAAEIVQIERGASKTLSRHISRLEDRVASSPDDRELSIQMEGARRQLATVQTRLDRLRQELNASHIALGIDDPSLLLRLRDRYVRVSDVSSTGASYSLLLGGLQPLERTGMAKLIMTPLYQRSVSDIQIAALESLKAEGKISRKLNFNLIAGTDSSEAELAGLMAGILGSVLIILVTMMLAVPLGIGAAIYLEEFAPRNWMTKIIQVNINNLAAVPSIVFGLLGAAIFINGVVIPVPFIDYAFRLGGGLGRGWPLAAGIVLALMTLPTIIITSRAALAAVPVSVRQAALAVGATRLQAVNHHVMPMAGPGILTGSIIGLAQAIGETAPLLLIGMVAFIGEMPGGVDDRTTALPVMIYQWSTRAERAWEPMTSAAIIVLLLLLLMMNALAVWLRLRYEKS